MRAPRQMCFFFFFFLQAHKISEGRGLLFIHSAFFESFRYRVCLSIETAQRRKFCVHICSGWEGRATRGLGWNLFLTVGQDIKALSLLLRQT